jgi:hypothetical protein
MPELKKCLVICALGTEGSPERIRANELMEHVINPALSHAFEITRADGINFNSSITRRILQEVLRCDLLIADITGGNPNVFYELALRHSQRKPFIQIRQKGTLIPFDVQDIDTIEYDLSSLSGAANAKRRIADVVSATMQFDNPAFDAIIDLQTLSRQSQLPFPYGFLCDFVDSNTAGMADSLSQYEGTYNVYAISRWAEQLETGPILCCPTEVKNIGGQLKWVRESYMEASWEGMFMVNPTGEILLLEHMKGERTNFQVSIYRRASEQPAQYFYGINTTYVGSEAKFRVRAIVMERVKEKHAPCTVNLCDLKPKVADYLSNTHGYSLDRVDDGLENYVEAIMLHISAGVQIKKKMKKSAKE